MSSTEADAAKAAGNAKLAAGDAHGAIQDFTKAIELDPTNHVYYSNRSAAFLRIGDADAAIKDANECIKVNSTWAKGHARKGRALFEKKLFGKASEAYRRAFELDSSNKMYEEYMKTMEQEDRYVRGLDVRKNTSSSTGSTGSTPSSSQTTPPPSSSSSASGSLRELLFSTPAKMRYTGLNALRMLIFSFALMFMFSGGMMTFALILVALLYAAQIIEQYGTPKFNQTYAQQVLPDWRTHYIMMSLLFMSLRPRFLLLMPTISHEIGHLAEFMLHVLPHVSPGILAKGTDFVNSTLMPRLTSIGAAEWKQYSLSTKWERFNQISLSMSANFEMGVLLMLLFDLFTPYRNLLGIFAYSQFLRMRYMASPQLQASFRNLDSRVAPLITNLPVVGPFYAKAKDYLSNMVDPAAQAAAAQRTPSCVIQ